MQTRASFILIFLFIMLSPMRVSSQIVTGAEQMDQYMPLLKGKRIGMVVNHTSVVGAKRVHLLDTLLRRDVRVVKAFAPEHGFRGNADAGETVKDGKDSRTGIPIVSLYGDNKKPSATQLKDVDVILFDIQDVGARFYTYISTMYYVMDACAENKKEMIVLDRPNPCDYVDGPTQTCLQELCRHASHSCTSRMYYRRTGTDDKRGRMDCQQEKSLFIKGNSNDRVETWRALFTPHQTVAQPPERSVYPIVCFTLSF